MCWIAEGNVRGYGFSIHLLLLTCESHGLDLLVAELDEVDGRRIGVEELVDETGLRAFHLGRVPHRILEGPSDKIDVETLYHVVKEVLKLEERVLVFGKHSTLMNEARQYLRDNSL